MQRSSLPAYLFGHFLVDFSCAFTLYRMIEEEYVTGDTAVALILAYNIIAFGAQFIFGLAGDLARFNGRLFASAGCIICGAGMIVGGWAPVLCTALIGAGNALFHAGGGTDALTRVDGASRAGIFVSSGALGLAAGTHFAASGYPPIQITVPLLMFAAAAIITLCNGKRGIITPPGFRKNEKPIIPGKAVPLFVILIAVFIRSWAGFAAPSPEMTGKFAWLLPAAAAFAGKFLGGVLADGIGSRLVGTVSAVLSAPLFLLGGSKTIFFLAAIFFLNMAMPVTLAEAAERLKGFEGFAFGLTALALLCGFIANYLAPLPEEKAKYLVPAACVIAAAAIFLTSGNRRPAADK